MFKESPTHSTMMDVEKLNFSKIKIKGIINNIRAISRDCNFIIADDRLIIPLGSI
jgi:hypothetical protein